MDPYIIKIGNFGIHWYSFILLCSFLLGSYLIIKECKKINIPKNEIEDFLFNAIIICLVGARIYYVIFEFNYYYKYPLDIIKVWEGGLAIHGGIIAGFIYLYYFCKKKKYNILKLMDIIVISLIIGQIIGRWGNFMNSEAYGPICSLKFLNNLHLPKFIIDGMYIDGVYHQPTFLYESLWNLMGLIILLIVKNRKFYKEGMLISLYLIWYGIGRFMIESLRTDSLMLLNLKVAQLVSLSFIGIGIFLLFNCIKHKTRV